MLHVVHYLFPSLLPHVTPSHYQFLSQFFIPPQLLLPSSFLLLLLSPTLHSFLSSLSLPSHPTFSPPTLSYIPHSCIHKLQYQKNVVFLLTHKSVIDMRKYEALIHFNPKGRGYIYRSITAEYANKLHWDPAFRGTYTMTHTLTHTTHITNTDRQALTVPPMWPCRGQPN